MRALVLGVMLLLGAALPASGQSAPSTAALCEGLSRSDFGQVRERAERVFFRELSHVYARKPARRSALQVQRLIRAAARRQAERHVQALRLRLEQNCRIAFAPLPDRL